MKILYFLLFASFLQIGDAFPSIKPIRPFWFRLFLTYGEEAQVGELPHQLMMEVNLGEGFFFRCGAVLINKLQALTAAHCLERRTAKDIRLYAGLHDMRKKSEAQEIFVRRIATPKEWNADNFIPKSDMAILTFTAPVTFNDNVQPIEWNDDPNETFAGEKCVISGWGLTENAMVSDTLQQAEIDVISNDECRNISMWRDHIYEEHVCIHHKTVGVCFWDNGGPLTCQKDGKPILVGVLAISQECDPKNPPGYERTSYFKQFISENLIKDETVI